MQQTPKPEAQFPSLVPPSLSHSSLVRQIPFRVRSDWATHSLKSAKKLAQLIFEGNHNFYNTYSFGNLMTEKIENFSFLAFSSEVSSLETVNAIWMQINTICNFMVNKSLLRKLLLLKIET